MKTGCHVLILAMLVGITAPAGAQLDTLRQGFLSTQERFKSIFDAEAQRIEAQFREESLVLPQAHIKALQQLEHYYQREGDLQSLLAVERERRRFARNPAPGEIQVSTASRRLAALQQTYIADADAVRQQRDRRLAALTERYEQRTEQEKADYLRALNQLQRELTQQGDITSAMEVLKESERIRTGGGAGPPTADRGPATGDAPHQSSAVTLPQEALRNALRGTVIEWNAQTRSLVLEYEFSREAMLQDWQGGEYDAARKLLVCNRTVAWLRPEFEQILEVQAEVLFLDDSRRGRLMFGHAGTVDLTVELAGDRGDPRLVVFQTSEDHRVVSESTDLKMVIENHLALRLSPRDLRWSVNYGREGRRDLQKELRFPAYLGVGSMTAVSGYNRIRVSGILSETYVRHLAAGAR